MYQAQYQTRYQTWYMQILTVKPPHGKPRPSGTSPATVEHSNLMPYVTEGFQIRI